MVLCVSASLRFHNILVSLVSWWFRLLEIILAIGFVAGEGGHEVGYAVDFVADGAVGVADLDGGEEDAQEEHRGAGEEDEQGGGSGPGRAGGRREGDHEHTGDEDHDRAVRAEDGVLDEPMPAQEVGDLIVYLAQALGHALALLAGAGVVKV